MTVITTIVTAFYIYLLLGLLFGLWFITRGADKIDPGMHESSWKVRILLLPGSALLWPVLVRKFFGNKSSETNDS